MAFYRNFLLNILCFLLSSFLHTFKIDTLERNSVIYLFIYFDCIVIFLKNSSRNFKVFFLYLHTLKFSFNILFKVDSLKNFSLKFIEFSITQQNFTLIWRLLNAVSQTFEKFIWCLGKYIKINKHCSRRVSLYLWRTCINWGKMLLECFTYCL